MILNYSQFSENLNLYIFMDYILVKKYCVQSSNFLSKLSINFLIKCAVMKKGIGLNENYCHVGG